MVASWSIEQLKFYLMGNYHTQHGKVLITSRPDAESGRCTTRILKVMFEDTHVLHIRIFFIDLLGTTDPTKLITFMCPLFRLGKSAIRTGLEIIRIAHGVHLLLTV